MREEIDEQGRMYDDIHHALGWKAMLDTEPQLADLRRDVLHTAREWSRGPKAQRPFCARQVMSQEIVPRLRPLVGRDRRREPVWLCQQAAFSRAYHQLLALLPACRSCNCPSSAEIMDDLFRPR
jgi:hypothetical protein